MGALLESLLALQDIELQIVDIHRQLAAKQRGVKRQAAKLRSAEEALETETEQLKSTQIHMDEIDVDLKSRSVHVGQLRDNLNTVRTNKEYAAVLSQLNTEKADVTRLETRAFELLSAVEEKKTAVTTCREQAHHEAQRLANLEQQFAQVRESFAGRLEQLQQARDRASHELDAGALDMFNRVSERYDGEVMARVIKPHPRRQEFLCDGCNMSLAAERANALMTRDEVITCDNCGRILYIVKDT